MSRVGRRDTNPEMVLRRLLHGAGFRYRVDVATLPGRPDIVFPSRKSVIFVHGCFWHGHDCSLFKVPKTRTEFWIAKISKNGERDRRAVQALHAKGWRVLTVWECALRGRGRLSTEGLLRACRAFLAEEKGRPKRIKTRAHFAIAGLDQDANARS
jgi:DNA mismatch endonuclease (patch repair protein)